MSAIKIIAENKKAFFDYELLEKFEAGIELTGPEVKSIRAGHLSIKEAFATVKDNQIWITNMNVSPYLPAGQTNVEQKRPRKLLLKRTEIDFLIGKALASGLTLVPTKIYFSHGLVKIEIAVGKGKKLHDKRETIRRRELDIETQRELKDR
jgi:SsrA-binding protein